MQCFRNSHPLHIVFFPTNLWLLAKDFDHNYLTTIKSGSLGDSCLLATAFKFSYLMITVTAPVAIFSIIPSLREKYSLSPSP